MTIPDHLTTAVLPTTDSELVGFAPTNSRILASGHSTLRNLLTTSAPTTVETLLPVPIPTFQGRSPIIRESSDLPISSPHVNTSDTTGIDYSWSHGLGLENSPIKTRSARRKATTSFTLPNNYSIDSSDLGVLRGIKSLARSFPRDFSPLIS